MAKSHGPIPCLNSGEDMSAAGPTPDPVKPAPPSRFVKIIMGPMTKVLNPLIVKYAGRPHFHMAARLTHTGRRSGRTYVTPVGARRAGDLVLIPLTFGNQSDWSRNVLTAGRCSLRLEGVDYHATTPMLLSSQEADFYVRAAFGRLERGSMRVLGIQQFLCLSVVPA
jgi:deazaflavin-dependent oxidoreductase (nitroreductase family)